MSDSKKSYKSNKATQNILYVDKDFYFENTQKAAASLFSFSVRNQLFTWIWV
jgi:hypothetical protein